MVLNLHLDKNKNKQEKATELFKRLSSAYENWRSNGTPAGQVGNNQHHNHTTTLHKLSVQPDTLTSNFCGQNEPQRETPQ